jgi:hypothetical protein
MSYTATLYGDVATLLRDGLADRPKPSVGLRSDGSGILYADAVNVLFGPPESAKTLTARCIGADVLFGGGSVLIIDIDHNGLAATVAGFRDLGVSEAVLSDPERFRYADPEDLVALTAIVKEATLWKPTFVLVDSVGELVPMLGGKTNDADDYTRVHRAILLPMALAGAAVLGIDHEPKGTEGSSSGPTGTMAKKRAIDGVMLRANIIRPFAPGQGGKSRLTIVKDRHGGLRASSPSNGKEPAGAVFELCADRPTWNFWLPKLEDTFAPDSTEQDVEKLKQHGNPSISVTEAKRLWRWGTDRAARAVRSYKDNLTDSEAYLVPNLKVGVREVRPSSLSDVPEEYRERTGYESRDA